MPLKWVAAKLGGQRAVQVLVAAGPCAWCMTSGGTLLVTPLLPAAPLLPPPDDPAMALTLALNDASPLSMCSLVSTLPWSGTRPPPRRPTSA